MSSDIETATKADEEKAELIMARTVCNEAVNVLIDTQLMQFYGKQKKNVKPK